MRLFRIAALCLLAALSLAAASGWWMYAQSPLTLAKPKLDIDIERGAAGGALAASLQRQGIALPGWAMSVALRLRGDAPRVRAGSYVLEAPLTLKGLLDRLTRGDVSLKEVVLIEGWNFRQVREALARQADLKPDSAALDDAALMRALGAEASHPEGLFAPDTYAYSRGSSDLEVLRRAYRLQQQRLQNASNSRATTPGAPPLRTPYEALILASIVEKETGKEADRVRVASVFANRLNRAMMLQSDPTTIYGMGEQFDGNLRRRDLRADTPYNTYTRHGLPPTPIAMPGKASLAAALNPASSTALYFVARGDGSSEFSDDLGAHNRAVARFQKK
jgi:UPF0755 protein